MAVASTHTKEEQLAWEAARRVKLGVPTLGAGIVYLLSGIIAAEAYKGLPTVGVVQGLRPALNGQAVPPVSPRAAEVIFLNGRSSSLIAGAILAAISILLATLAITFLYDAARYRRPETLAAGRPLVIFGGVMVAIVSVASQVISAISTHAFVVSHNHSNLAVDHALSTGTGRVIVAYAALLSELCFAVGVVVASVNAMRTGLVNRLMGILGVVAAVLFVLPISQTLSLISALWLVALGILYLGRWPGGDPPAWAAGEAIPWPSQAQTRAGGSPRPARRGLFGGARAAGPSEPADSTTTIQDAPPAPVAPVHVSSNKRKRKRGAQR